MHELGCLVVKQTTSLLMQTQRYRVRNWPQYTRALIQRGSITVWVEESAIKGWLSVFATGKAGRPETYRCYPHATSSEEEIWLATQGIGRICAISISADGADSTDSSL